MNIERSWQILDHTADVIIEGKGKTLEKAFEAIAIALQNVMVDTETIKPVKNLEDSIKLQNPSKEELLFEFLSRIVFIKDTKKFVFKDIEVKIKNDNNFVEVYFLMKGEKLSIKKHKIYCDVKGVSYSELKIVQENNYYICKCVVDV